MKQNFDIHRDVWGPYMTLITNVWGETVFKSVDRLHQLDIHINNTIGTLPDALPKIGNKSKLTQDGIFLKYLASTPEEKEKVKYFDICAEEYEWATHTYKSYFVPRALQIVKSQLHSSFYILDVACGPGYELERLKELVPQGEVIGLDLSTDMIKRAYRNAKFKHLSNVGFYQADINTLPMECIDHFDVVFCNISLQYFESIENVFHQFFKALRKNGKLIIVEPLGSATQKLSQTVLKQAIPHFQKFYSRDRQIQLLETAGLTFLYWEEIQKDIGLTIAMK